MPDYQGGDLDVLNRAIKGLSDLRVAIELVSEHLASLQRQTRDIVPAFDRSGQLVGGTYRMASESPDRLRLDALPLELVSNCEWLPKYVDNLWQAHRDAETAISSLPQRFFNELDGLKQTPWLAGLRRYCLDVILTWPGELGHQNSYGAEKVAGRLDQLLEKAAKRDPFSVWSRYSELLAEAGRDLVAIRHLALQPETFPAESTHSSERAQLPVASIAIGLVPVALQQLGHEVRSLAMTLHCCNQQLADEASQAVMRRIQEQVHRIRALLPKPLVLADCDVMARQTIHKLAEWLNVIEPELINASPPFQVPELAMIYGIASELDRHADSDARRKSTSPPFTELQRQKLQQKYGATGATEYLRRCHAGETDDAVERVNAGMIEALRRFPELRCWAADDWSLLFFCSSEVIEATLAWQSIKAQESHVETTSRSEPMSEQSSDAMPPKVFISYSWDDEEHKSWVKGLAARLRQQGTDVTLDRWAVVPGDQLPRFMETAIRDNDYVVIICTPNYKLRSDQRVGGVGYEGDIMTAEVLNSKNDRKFIAVRRSGDWDSALPSWLKGKYSIDFSGDPYSEVQYEDLLVTLHNKREQAPPIGKAPDFKRGREEASTPEQREQPSDPQFEPLKIEGILVDEIGRPVNDGTQGSALYSIPFKLDRAPSQEWADLFIRTWDHPPKYSTSHRPGIARIVGPRIILTETTIEEVRDAHRETLALVVKTVNEQIAAIDAKRQHAEQQGRHQEQEHLKIVQRIANDIKFD